MELTFVILLLSHFQLVFTAEEVDVLILGAGFSGIGAASHLHKEGFESFLVLEANDYIGGRVKHASFEGETIELGAGWVEESSDEQAYLKLAKPFNIEMHKDNMQNIVFRYENGTKADTAALTKIQTKLEESFEVMDEIMEKRVESKKGTVSARVGVGMSGWRVDTLLKQAVEHFQFDYENAVCPLMSDAYTYSVTGYESESYIVTDQRGYSYPIVVEAKKFQNKIHLNTEVKRVVQLANKRLEVYASNGKQYIAKHVLVTFSSGVLLSNYVTFQPKLPMWKSAVLNMVPMGHYCRYFVSFNETFWNKDVNYFIIATMERGHYSLWQNLNSNDFYMGKNMALVTLTGKFCLKEHSKTDDEVKMEIYDVLKKAYANATYPKGILRSKWSTDPHFMGSYSYQVPGITEYDYKALEQPVMNNTLWFTGEHTARWEFGYVHSAIDIGLAEAKRILKCLKSNDCPPELHITETEEDPCEHHDNNSIKTSTNLILVMCVTFIAALLLMKH